MELTLTQQNGYSLGEISGVITEAGEPQFRELLHPIIRKRGSKLVLDLSQAARIDSVGISHLVRLVSDANTHDSRVIIAAAAPFVATVFEVTKLNRFFELAPTVSQALDQLGVSA